MRPIAIISASLLMASLVFGQASTTKEESTAPAGKTAVAHKVAVKRVSGTLVSADVAAHSIVVKEGRGEAAKDETYMVGASVKIHEGKKAVTLADLKPESSVRLTLKEVEGALQVVDIVATPVAVKK